jgi:hypothetical protein
LRSSNADSDLLSILIDDALRGADPSTIVKLYTAPPELNPFSEEAICPRGAGALRV